MARKTLIQSFAPTEEELNHEKINRDRIRREHKKLEIAAKRFGMPFDSSGMSLWNLAVRLELEWSRRLKKKELSSVGTPPGRKPTTRSGSQGLQLIHEVEAGFKAAAGQRKKTFEEVGKYKGINPSTVERQYYAAKKCFR